LLEISKISLTISIPSKYEQTDFAVVKFSKVNFQVKGWFYNQPLAFKTDQQKYNIVSDYLGTPFEMYDQSGGRVWQGELDSFGAIQNFKGDSKTDCPFRYQGQYEDAETGLYYNRFRYYSPEEGLYLSQDPTRLDGGDRLYGYVQKPNEMVDPSGLSGALGFDTLKKMAQSTLDFSTKQDGAVFWSDKNMKRAQKWAESVGKTTLEQTKGGKILNDMELFSDVSGLTKKQAAEIWDIASKRFADEASGIVNVFSTGAKRMGQYGERTWWRIEKPALLKNMNVTNILVRKVDGTLSKIGNIIKC
jgi:RHS repeat-associated protein